MDDLVIIGAGGFGRETAWLVEEINRRKPSWNLLGYIDEDKEKWGQVRSGYPVLGGEDTLEALHRSVLIICAIADPGVKYKLARELAERGRNFASLVHPDTYLAPSVRIGAGVIISKSSILTTDIAIGDHVGINPGCGIGHDTVIGNYCTLMWHVNVSGAVQVGEGCTLGTQAVLLQGLKVGAWSIVGAGAVVTGDLPPRCTAVGVPARPVR